jgi:hypothetical protein
MPDFDSMRAPSAQNLFRPYSVTSFRDKQLPPATAGDLVDAGGRCVGPMMSAEPTPGSASEATVPGGITLEMTECEVVQRAGAVQNVNIGTGESGERTAALTFIGGPRPGIYHFAGGRLKSMERGPEPPQQATPAKRTKSKGKTAER